MKMWSQLFIDLLTLFTLIVTAVFVIKYWEETQDMKNQMIQQTKEMVEQTKISSHMNEQMITQTKISSQALKASLLPLLDVSIEMIRPFTEDFAYDVRLHNKGNGPAFNITIIQWITKRDTLRPPTTGDIKPFEKRIPIIGKGETVTLHKERSDSHDSFAIKVMYKNLLGDLEHCIFEGNRDGLKVKEHPMLKAFQNDKSNNSERN